MANINGKKMEVNKIYQGNSIDVIKTIPDGSIDCCITSPPYWGLRDYGVDGQIGLEKTPEEYVVNLVSLFREVKRVLKDDGTLWLNLGDSYWGGKGQSGSGNPEEQAERVKNGVSINQSYHQIAGDNKTRPQDGKHPIIKPKDLVGIPWMTAFALRADGWYLRQDIIWHKPNPMPESVTDRCTKSHEYIFLLSKSQKYYFDHEAIMEEAVTEPHKPGWSTDMSDRRDRQKDNESNQRTWGKFKNLQDKGQSNHTMHERRADGLADEMYAVRNKRDVWTVNTKPFKEAHFATFPEKLIIDMIKSGCPKGGIVLDPFMGAGTTALVARKLERNYVGCELNPKYIEIAERRLYAELGLFV